MRKASESHALSMDIFQKKLFHLNFLRKLSGKGEHFSWDRSIGKARWQNWQTWHQGSASFQVHGAHYLSSCRGYGVGCTTAWLQWDSSSRALFHRLQLWTSPTTFHENQIHHQFPKFMLLRNIERHRRPSMKIKFINNFLNLCWSGILSLSLHNIP